MSFSTNPKQQMSSKRTTSEFQDPDYPKNIFPSVDHCVKRQKIENTSIRKDESCISNTINRVQRIREIIEREFKIELSRKQDEIFKLSDRIYETKKLLHKVRYAAVSKFYNKVDNPSAKTTSSSIINIFSDVKPGQSGSQLQQQQQQQQQIQNALHPALKTVLGLNDNDYDELIKLRPTRKAARTAINTIKEKLQTKKEKRIERELLNQLQITENNDDKKILKETSTTETFGLNTQQKWDKPVAKINSNRGGNLMRQLIVVGNTSKYIGNHLKSNDKVTHKWLTYCQTKTENPIESFVRKVRFILHPSYKPNDVVDVITPPFILTRHGWGEFPIRVQFFFHPNLRQKPLQVFHHLVLDKKLTGLQTMGSETLLEIWIRSNFFFSNDNHQIHEAESESINNIDKLPNSEDEGNDLREFLNQIETSSVCYDADKIEPTLSPRNQYIPISPRYQQQLMKIKEEPNVEKSPIKICNERNSLESQKSYQIMNCKIKYETEVPLDINLVNTLIKPSGFAEKEIIENLATNSSVECIINNPNQKNNDKQFLTQNKIICKNGRKIMIDSIAGRFKSKQQSLLKPGISLLKKSMTKKSSQMELIINRLSNLLDHDYSKPAKEAESCQRSDKIIQGAIKNYSNKFENEFKLKKFENHCNAIEYLLQSMPLINPKAKNNHYRISFPFIICDLEKYYNYMEPKRKAHEWMQARYFSKLMKQHQQFKDCFWSTREVIIYSRSHGFTPNIGSTGLGLANGGNVIKQEKDDVSESKLITLSSCTPVFNWLKDEKKSLYNFSKIEKDELINVIETKKTSCQENVHKKVPEKQNSILLKVPEQLQNESNIVRDSCFDIGIRLKPEIIHEGISSPLGEIMLSKALKCFIEDLLKRVKICQQNEERQNISVSVLESHHIINAIMSNKNLDFLTNKYLGTL